MLDRNTNIFTDLKRRLCFHKRLSFFPRGPGVAQTLQPYEGRPLEANPARGRPPPPGGRPPWRPPFPSGGIPPPRKGMGPEDRPSPVLTSSGGGRYASY